MEATLRPPDLVPLEYAIHQGLIPAAAAAALAAGLAAPLLASTNQQFVIQDDGALRTNLAGTLETMRGLR